MVATDNVTIDYGNKSVTLSLLQDCSVSDHVRNTRSFYELPFLEALRDLLHPETVVFDVGAHIGNHTVYFAAILGLRVWAFEPNPSAYALLKRNIEENDLDPLVSCFPVALSDTVRRVGMAPSSPADAGTMRVLSSEGPEGEFDVETRVLDMCTAEVTPGPIFLKLDVEGHEPSVIRGGKRFIELLKPDISAEVSDVEQFDDLVELLSEAYEPRALFNSTPTVVFRPVSSEFSLKHQISLARYGVEQGLNYNLRRTWYLEQKRRAESFEARIEDLSGRLHSEQARSKALESEISSLRLDARIANAFGTWLDQENGAAGLNWTEDIRSYFTDESETRDVRALVVSFGQSGAPAPLLSTVFKSLDVAQFDLEGELGLRLSRFVDGRLFREYAITQGLDAAELAAAEVSLFVGETPEPVGILVLLGGERAPELEHFVRSLIDAPYLVVSFDTGYQYSRLGTLVGADRIYLDSDDGLASWNRVQILPASTMDSSEPTALTEAMSAAAESASRGELSVPTISRHGDSRVLLVSYYAPPASPVSVHRLAYWHSRLPVLARERGRTIDAVWLTATAGAKTQSQTVVVPDRGPLHLPDDRYEAYQDLNDSGLDTLGASWSYWVKDAIGQLEGEFSTVLISGNPFHYFDLTETFKDQWDSKVILDFRDPFAYNPRLSYSVPQREHLIRLERRWVEAADAVISVNQACLDSIAPDVEVVRRAIANGFDESVVDAIEKPSTGSEQEPIRIAYSGTIFANLPVDDLLDALPATRYRFLHFGRDYSRSQASTTRAVSHPLGLLSYEDLIRQLKTCHAGIIMTTGESSTQTTKLFDYVACDLDIVIVTQGEPRTGDLHALTKDLEGVFWVRDDRDDLRSFFQAYEPSRVSRPQRKVFSRRHETMQLLELVEELEGS